MITSLDEISKGMPWVPKDDKHRLERYEFNRQMYRGHHEHLNKEWYKLIRQDIMASLEFVLNFHKRQTTLFCDLLLSEPPRIDIPSENEKVREVFKTLINENLFRTLYMYAIDYSRYGDGILKVRYNNKSIIEVVPPKFWFPVCMSDNIKDFAGHVLATTFSVSKASAIPLTKDSIKQYVKFEIHEQGKLTNKVFELSNDRLGNQIELNRYFSGLEETVDTEIDDFLVFPAFNSETSDRINGISDYEDISSIIREIEIRVAQINRILDKHSDPNMYGPESALIQDESGNYVVKGGGVFYPVGAGEEPPGYVTWDGSLENQYKEIEILMDMLYLISETSPAAFGQQKQGLAESGSALKRLLLAPLAHTARMRMVINSTVKKAIKYALMLECKAQGVSYSDDEIEVNINWRDGLPEDAKEMADIESTRTGGKATSSVKSAIMRLDDKNKDEAEKELEQIIEEENSTQPELFKTPLNPDNSNNNNNNNNPDDKNNNSNIGGNSNDDDKD